MLAQRDPRLDMQKLPQNHPLPPKILVRKNGDFYFLFCTPSSAKRMSKDKGKELSPVQYFDKNGKEIKAGMKILTDEHIAIFLKIG